MLGEEFDSALAAPVRLFFRTAQHGKKLSLSGWKLGISIPLRTGPKPSKAADECAAETQQATSPLWCAAGRMQPRTAPERRH